MKNDKLAACASCWIKGQCHPRYQKWLDDECRFNGDETQMRRISLEDIGELHAMESVEPHVYTCQAGHLTIGVGHKITPHELESGLLLIDGQAVRWINGLTTEQVDGLLRADLFTAEMVVNACVTVPLTDNQFAALVSLCFNIGAVAFERSSVVRVLNQGNYHLVPGFFRLWNKVTIDGKKVVSRGLVNRREAEINLWMKP